jgi:two-component system chemotaxis response regulator CheY
LSYLGGHERVPACRGTLTFRAFVRFVTGADENAQRCVPEGESGVKTVLIVDDSEMIRRHVAETLRGGDYNVIEAGDGVDALAQITSNPELCLVILDINMPRMNGLELLERMKVELGALAPPVLMLTTEAQPSLMKRAKDNGAKGWIIKPVNPTMLLSAVGKVAR